MKTELLKISGVREEDERVIARAAEIIKNGGLVAVPTETVYGLAGSALIPSSAEKIYAAKGRPSDNPLIVHIARPAEAENIAHTTELYYKLAERFMPGPLTVILKKKPVIPDTVTAGLDSVAIRCPSNPVAHRLIEMSHPIAAPSANRSGIPSPTTAEHVTADMDGRIDMIIDGGECDIGLESTIVKLDEDGCTILRPGAVTEDMLREVCGTVSVSRAVTEPSLADGERPESPGMKYKHYAPSAEVILVDAPHDRFWDYVKSNASGRYGVLISNDDACDLPGCVMLFTGARGDSREASRRLFSLLRRADELGLERVYAPLPPTGGEYLALYNRMIRAAGGRIVRPAP